MPDNFAILLDHGSFMLTRANGGLYATVAVMCTFCRCQHMIQDLLTLEQVQSLREIVEEAQCES